MTSTNPRTTPAANPAQAAGTAIHHVFAAGCPRSGWEAVIPVLENAGLESAGETLAPWYNELYRANGGADPLHPGQPLQPDASMTERAATLLPKDTDTPQLIADSHTTWLLDFWAESLPEARFLLFYTDPDSALANALQQNIQDPVEYLAHWEAANRHLIRFQRRHRERALLLNADAACENPKALPEICRRTGLELQFTGSQHEPATQPPPLLEQLLARQIVATQPAIKALQKELTARAYPIGDPSSEESRPDALMESYRTQKKTQQSLENTRKDLEQENELLLLQLHQVQEELEHYFLKYQEISKEKETIGKQLQEQLNKTRTAQQALQTTNKKLENQRQQLQKQLNKTRNAQQSLLHANEKWQKKNVLLQLKLHRTQNELQKNNRNTLLRTLAAPFKRRNNYKKMQKQIELIRQSGYLNETWYLSQYPDVEKTGMDPVEHYLRHGDEEGRDPSTNFSTCYYLLHNPDVTKAGMNPLLHYILYGSNEARKTTAQ